MSDEQFDASSSIEPSTGPTGSGGASVPDQTPESATTLVPRIPSAEVLRHAEAILMIAEEPVPAGLLAQVLEEPVADIAAGLAALSAEYEANGHGFCLREVAGGWRFYSHPESSAYVERFVLTSENPRLSKAAVETLAIVAYKQPISRAQVAEVRGVNCDGVFRTLNLRGLIEPVGTDDGPGTATLYGTTALFLERMGLRGLDELPRLAEYVPEPETAARYDAALSTENPAAADPEVAARLKSSFTKLRAAFGGAGSDATTDADSDGDGESEAVVSVQGEVPDAPDAPEPAVATDAADAVLDVTTPLEASADDVTDA